MNRPNFFIVGAPKCGTTALSVYLGQHPQVFFCSPKEPYFFATDFPRHRVAENLDDYLALFARATPEHRAIGEGSAGYLYSETAVPRILEFDSQARLIVLLRNPIDLAYSMHGQACFDGDEDEHDFPTAWNLQSERECGHQIPGTCRQVKLLLYKKLASLGEQVARLFQVVPRQQVKVIALPELIATPRQVYDDVCEFLEIPSDGRTDFTPVNEAKRHRFRALGRFARQPPQLLLRGMSTVKRALRIQRLGLIDRFLVVKRRRPALTADFRARLTDEFREDVAKLSDVLQRDFRSWLRVD